MQLYRQRYDAYSHTYVRLWYVTLNEYCCRGIKISNVYVKSYVYSILKIRIRIRTPKDHIIHVPSFCFCPWHRNLICVCKVVCILNFKNQHVYLDSHSILEYCVKNSDRSEHVVVYLKKANMHCEYV